MSGNILRFCKLVVAHLSLAFPALREGVGGRSCHEMALLQRWILLQPLLWGGAWGKDASAGWSGLSSISSQNSEINDGALASSQWQPAHATFFNKTSEPNGPLGGDCGYTNDLLSEYGESTVALSTVIFNDGLMCGACFEIKCWNDTKCLKGSPSITVTATTICPPNSKLPNDNGGWCNPPRTHFDLWQPSFLKLAPYKAGIIPVQYRRVACLKKGGIQLTINGSEYYNTLLVSNVAGSGDVRDVEIKGSQTGWLSTTRKWGQLWEFNKQKVAGQSLSFRITTGDHKNVTLMDAIPPNWEYNRTYSCKEQFSTT